MLKIKKEPVADLREQANLAAHSQDIAAAMAALLSQVDDELSEGFKQSVIERLVLWSHDEQSLGYGSWNFAVRAAYLDVKEGGGLGLARGEVAKGRGEKKFTMAMGSVNWANCGKTANNILVELAKVAPSLGAARAAELTAYPPGHGLALVKALAALPDPGTVLLFDCSFPQVHTFVVEAHPNGNRYLCQGYQGVYYANWWTGTDERGLRLTAKELEREVSAEDMRLLQGVRKDFGSGRPIPQDAYEGMLSALATALDAAAAPAPSPSKGEQGDLEMRERAAEKMAAAASWGAFAEYWPKLPFCPLAREKHSVASRGERPVLEVTVHVLPDLSRGTGTSISVPVVPAKIDG